MKTVLFVPGFQEDIHSRNYKSTLEAIKDKGYSVKFISIHWRRTILDDWVRQFDKEYKQYNPADTILAGFSYGALIAFMAATKQNPAELWLLSFSPFFSDDMPKLKKSWLKQIGKRRIENFKQIHFDNLAGTINCKTLILYGELEAKRYPLLSNRAKLAHKAIRNSTLIEVTGAGHDVTSANYITSLKNAIQISGFA